MAGNSTFTPKASLCDAPTNLKEAIDWVLRVTGRDGKALEKDKGECICGLAAAVTDLLQSVTLEYHGYQGDSKETGNNKGATETQVTNHLNELFSLVQGLGGTAVVRTYIDQLAQVLSALVGWSEIEKCWGSSGKGCDGTSECKNGGRNGGKCKYLDDVEHENKCGCMKWEVPEAGKYDKGHHLGRRCTKCKGSGSTCSYSCYGNNYKSSYSNKNDSQNNGTITTWKNVDTSTDRSKCARILLGSVCLIWSGITYMHWTGKWTKGSPYWNNHILDGSGLDDGTLSQWLQALGFPRKMLNDAGPGNRLDAVIWDGLREKLFWGFAVPSGLSGDVVKDDNGNTARSPFGMNYAGFIHTAHRDSFNTDRATVFPKDGTASSSSSGTDTNIHKCGALFKLYILSCAYFTGLQKRTTESTAQTTTTNNYPKTIREILYWLSALPYSQAYKEMLTHAKKELEKVLKKPGDSDSTTSETQLKFTQQGRSAPITVDEFNLFAHFQAVTQYCPLVLIGIQGGLHSTAKGIDSPAIHSLYANTECNFTYPSV